jgi:hypothetical protein
MGGQAVEKPSCLIEKLSCWNNLEAGKTQFLKRTQ